MSRRWTKLLKGLLSALHYSGADRLVAPLIRGVGAIFTLHARRFRTQPHPPGYAAVLGAGHRPDPPVRI
jgi:hypothetical protein